MDPGARPGRAQPGRERARPPCSREAAWHSRAGSQAGVSTARWSRPGELTTPPCRFSARRPSATPARGAGRPSTSSGCGGSPGAPRPGVAASPSPASRLARAARSPRPAAHTGEAGSGVGRRPGFGSTSSRWRGDALTPGRQCRRGGRARSWGSPTNRASATAPSMTRPATALGAAGPSGVPRPGHCLRTSSRPRARAAVPSAPCTGEARAAPSLTGYRSTGGMRSSQGASRTPEKSMPG